MSQREKLSKMTRPFALYMHATSLPNIDGELPSMPLNFELPVETRAGHTGQTTIMFEEGIDSFDQLGASPCAANSATGRLHAFREIAFAGAGSEFEGSGKGTGTLGVARREGCGFRRQRQGGTGTGKSGYGGRAGGDQGDGGEGKPGRKRERGRGPGEQQQAATVVGGGRGQPMAEPIPHRQVCGVLERENDD